MYFFTVIMGRRITSRCGIAFYFATIGTILGASIAGCNSDPHPTDDVFDEVGMGTVTNSTYRNDYFGLSLTIPSDWSVRDEETRKREEEKALRKLAGGDKEMEKVVVEMLKWSRDLLVATQYPIGAAVEYNPRFEISVTKTSRSESSENEWDRALEQTAHLLPGEVEVKAVGKPTFEQVGGIEFESMSIQRTSNAGTETQKFYTAYIKGFSFYLRIAYANDAEKAKLLEIIDSISFDESVR